jgi:hypothetical protein
MSDSSQRIICTADIQALTRALCLGMLPFGIFGWCNREEGLRDLSIGMPNQRARAAAVEHKWQATSGSFEWQRPSQ